MRVRQRLAGNGSPGFEPLLARRESADPRLDGVRHDKSLVHGEQPGKLGLVCLELTPRRPYGCVLVGRVLQLDNREGQPIDEQDNVGPPGIVFLGYGELVDSEQVVGVWVVEVENADLVSTHPSAPLSVLHLYAVDQHPMGCAVVDFESRSLRARELAEGVVQRVGGQAGVECSESVPQLPVEYHLSVAVALRVWRSGGDVRPVRYLPAEGAEPVERDCFDVGFGQGGFHGLNISMFSTSKSRTFRVTSVKSCAFAVPAMNISIRSGVCPARSELTRNLAAQTALASSTGRIRSE